MLHTYICRIQRCCCIQQHVFWFPFPILADGLGESEAYSSIWEHEKLLRCLIISFIYWNHLFFVQFNTAWCPEAADFHSSHHVQFFETFLHFYLLTLQGDISDIFRVVIGRKTKRSLLSLADQFKISQDKLKFLWEKNAHNINKSRRFLPRNKP